MRKRFGKRAAAASHDKAHTHHRFFHPKAVFALGLLAGAGVLVFWFYKYNQTPAVGVVHAPVGQQSDTKGATSSSHFKSATIAFDYPTDYATVENKPASPPAIEQYMLRMYQPGKESRSISIAVKKLPSGEPFAEDSAYKFRKITPEYTESTETIGGLAAKKLTKKDGSEITYFIPGAGMYAIIAATSTTPKEALVTEMAALAQSFVWVR